MLAAVVSGWLLALVLLPAVAIVVPLLLSAPPNREVEVLAGLAEGEVVVASANFLVDAEASMGGAMPRPSIISK